MYLHFQVLVNTESCVNTLQEECTEFYLDRRRDGRNYSSRDRYPCYYTPHHGDFVTSRYVNKTIDLATLPTYYLPRYLKVGTYYLLLPLLTYSSTSNELTC